MSNPFGDQQNPYASPPAFPQPPAFAASPKFTPIDRIQHRRMYSYVFESPNWMANVGFTALCCLIPVVGPLVMFGYQFEIVTALLVAPDARYPDFSFNRFADYLVRGLWPFLVQLVASLVLVPIMFLIMMLPVMLVFGVAAGAGDEDAAGVAMLVVMPVFVIFVLILSGLFHLVMMPFMLRAGLAQDFMEGFNFGWVTDFLKKTWKEGFKAILFLIFTAAMLSFLGILACYVGMFVVMPFIFFAQAHLYFQMYLLYLSRGGTPVVQKIPMVQAY